MSPIETKEIKNRARAMSREEKMISLTQIESELLEMELERRFEAVNKKLDDVKDALSKLGSRRELTLAKAVEIINDIRRAI